MSRGRYDGDVIENGWRPTARTGLGKIEIGITDGAGYALAVSGPKVDAGVSLEDPRTSFFRDPATQRAVIELFALRTEVGASVQLCQVRLYQPVAVRGAAGAVLHADAKASSCRS